ncbi:hypothetical protein A2U01_0085977, partial [Trifolium medium]|nr:hypothetical protein [Trifolium medium]
TDLGDFHLRCRNKSRDANGKKKL